MHQRGSDARLAGLVAAAAAVVHLVATWVPSYWYDEAATLRLARLPIADLLEFTSSRDAVHAAYAIAMHGWLGLAGESEFAARLPSVLATALATAGVFALTRRLGGTRQAGLAAALVFAVLPRTFLQSAEARSYAIATALVVAAALLLVHAVSRRRWWVWLAYALVAALAIWWFAYAALVLPAFGLLAWARGARAGRWVRAGAAMAAPGILAVPLLVIIVGQRGQVAWLANQAVDPYTVAIEPAFGWAAWLAAGLAVILVVGVRRGSIGANATTASLVVWLVLPAVVLVGAGLLGQPLFTPRYLTASTPALAVICGLAVGTWSRRVVVALGVAWVVAAAPFAVLTRMPTAKPGGLDLRAVATVIREGSEPGDAFLLGSEGVGALRPRAALAAYPGAFENLGDLAFVRAYPEVGTYWDEVRDPGDVDFGDIDRVWVATRGEDPYAELLAAAGFAPGEHTRITGIDVTLWQR
jgi:mannosyltransferase